MSDTSHGTDGHPGPAFEPYFTSKEPGEGSGLGLAVAHGILKSHGGFITFESEIGNGTRS